MLPVAVDGIRHVPAEAARIYARVGSTLCETPVHFHLNGLRTGGTIHKDEIFLLEHLLNPASEGDAFVVGTAFGLSSVVLALLLPRVRVISLDNWSEGDDALEARAVCERLAGLTDDPGPRLTFVTGTSPSATPDALRTGTGRLSLVLIDGLRTNAQLVADYDGVEPFLDARTMLLLHDVRLFGLWDAVREIAGRGRFDTLVLLNSSTGLVAAFNRDFHPRAFDFLHETQVVAHWRPELAEVPGSTTSYPAIGWDPEADRREGRYDDSRRTGRRAVIASSPVVSGRWAANAPAPAWVFDPIRPDPRPREYDDVTALDRAGRTHEALARYRRLLRCWPEQAAVIRYNIASLLARAGQERRSRAIFGALASSPAIPAHLRAGSCFHLAQAAVEAGNRDGAIDLLRAALLFRPDHVAARHRLDALVAERPPQRQPAAPLLVPSHRVRRTRSEDGPVLVYQMGKVGSTSIAASLRRLLPQAEIHQLHYLREETLQRFERWLSTDPAVPSFLRESTCGQAEEARRVRERLLAGGPRWRIVTLTREPIGHMLSVLFHHIELYTRKAGAHGTAARRVRLLEAYLTRAADAGINPPEDADPAMAALTVAHRWFDTELGPVLDLDVYATPVDHERGYVLYRTRRADVLLMRLEDLAWAGAAGMRRLLGVDGFVLRSENRSKHKPASGLQAELVRTVCLPDAFLREAYGSRYARHFYSDDERRALLARWSLPSSVPATSPG